MTAYRIKQHLMEDGAAHPHGGDIDVPTVAKAKAKARKSWTRLAELLGPTAVVRTELFAVDPMTRSEKPVAKLEGRWPDVPHWRNF